LFRLKLATSGYFYKTLLKRRYDSSKRGEIDFINRVCGLVIVFVPEIGCVGDH